MLTMHNYYNYYFIINLFFTGLFYYMLGNLRPELRSTYKTTQLIACVSSNNIKKYGFGPILDH